MAILRFFDGPIVRFPACVCLVISVAAGAAFGADRAEWRSECAKITDDAERLRCFDKYAGRIPEDETEDDNPGIEDYLGYGQLNVLYSWRGHVFGLLARNNLHAHGNKGALQATWSFPLLPSVSGYVQYFNGYGESLPDYNASANRFGVGFILKEW